MTNTNAALQSTAIYQAFLDKAGFADNEALWDYLRPRHLAAPTAEDRIRHELACAFNDLKSAEDELVRATGGLERATADLRAVLANGYRVDSMWLVKFAGQAQEATAKMHAAGERILLLIHLRKGTV